MTEGLDLSLVIGIHNMQRELPRTLATLSRAYQCGIESLRYELIIVDNGSDHSVDRSAWQKLRQQSDCDVRYLRFPPGNPSPVKAINEGLRAARGRLVGLMIDGARMLSPGILGGATRAARLHSAPVICTHGFHLGPDLQARSMRDGYDQRAEDRLLAGVDWQADGYRLLDISVFAGSSFRGWFVNPTESNCLIITGRMWKDLGYLDERFVTPGGGLVNLDIFKRACESAGSQLVLLLGEGTFHQIHGGAATGNTSDSPNELFDREYEQIRGTKYHVPTYPAILLGEIHRSARRHLSNSAHWLAAQP